MAKIIDITEKLSYDDIAILKIKETELEVKIDAKTVMLALNAADDVKLSDIDRLEKMKDILLTKKSAEALEEMRLTYKSYVKVLETAFTVAIGDDEEEQTEGEQETAATT
ncbi:MAG: hypothetical protein ACI4TK_09795 [Agathobacter sp.]